MLRYGTRFDDQSTITRRGRVDGRLLGGRRRRPPVSVRDVVGDPHAGLACAAEAIEQVEQEIDNLWFVLNDGGGPGDVATAR